jgi:hypothetical protein
MCGRELTRETEPVPTGAIFSDSSLLPHHLFVKLNLNSLPGTNRRYSAVETFSAHPTATGPTPPARWFVIAKFSQSGPQTVKRQASNESNSYFLSRLSDSPIARGMDRCGNQTRKTEARGARVPPLSLCGGWTLLPDQQCKPRKQEVAAGVIDHVDLAGIKPGFERREWNI